MKTKNLILVLLCVVSLYTYSQSVEGQLTLNGKSQTNVELKSSSAVQLFKEFKTGKHQLGFSFKGSNLKQNANKEEVVFFEFITIVKKDNQLLKKHLRKQPIPYFPGEMNVPAEAFDFISILANTNQLEMSQLMKKDQIGLMPSGTYQVELIVKPVGVKGSIKPLIFEFKIN